MKGLINETWHYTVWRANTHTHTLQQNITSLYVTTVAVAACKAHHNQHAIYHNVPNLNWSLSGTPSSSVPICPLLLLWGCRIQTQQIGIRSLYCLCHRAIRSISASAEEGYWLSFLAHPRAYPQWHTVKVRKASKNHHKVEDQRMQSVFKNTFAHSKALLS